jgi:hypothetical protein
MGCLLFCRKEELVVSYLEWQPQHLEAMEGELVERVGSWKFSVGKHRARQVGVWN